MSYKCQHWGNLEGPIKDPLLMGENGCQIKVWWVVDEIGGGDMSWSKTALWKCAETNELDMDVIGVGVKDLLANSSGGVEGVGGGGDGTDEHGGEAHNGNMVMMSHGVGGSG